MLLAAVVVMVSALVKVVKDRNRDQFPPHPIFLRNAMSGKRSCTSTFPSQPGPQVYVPPPRPWMYRRMRPMAIHAVHHVPALVITWFIPTISGQHSRSPCGCLPRHFFPERGLVENPMTGGQGSWEKARARCLRGQPEGMEGWRGWEMGLSYYCGHGAWGVGGERVSVTFTVW